MNIIYSSTQEALTALEDHYRKGDFSKTIELAALLREMPDSVQHPETVFRSLILAGNAHVFTANYIKALECFNIAVEMAHNVTYPQAVSSALNAKGYMYLSIGEFAKAEQNLLRAKESLQEETELLGIVLLNLSIVDFNKKNFSEALTSCTEALRILKGTNKKRSVGYGLLNKAKITLSLANYSETQLAAEEALACFHHVGDKLGLAQIHVVLGELYSAQQWQHQSGTMAQQHLQTAEELLETIGAKKHLYEVHKLLAELYEQQQHWQQSCVHLKEYFSLYSEVSITEVQKKAELLEAELTYSLVKKEAELFQLQNVELLEINTRLDKAMKDLQNGEQQLIQAEKMSSLGQLTAGIAHEINNPINFIKASVIPLKRDVEFFMSDKAKTASPELLQEMRDEVDSLLRAIEDGARRSSEIVKGLKTFVRLDEGVVKSADIHEGLDATLVLLRSQISNGITIHKDYSPLPNVQCYPGLINQVFMNVLVNAIHAVGKQGEITISTYSEGAMAVVKITDTGVGMSAEVIRKIFEPFYTTKPVGEGTGLGLSISFGIIEKHHGTIRVESEVGVGTSFIISLPFEQPTPVE